MPSADTFTIKTQIIDNVVSTLAAVKKSAGYNRNIRTVERKSMLITEPSLDVVMVRSAREVKNEYAYKVRDVTLTLFLACLVEDGANVPKAVDDLAADIEKALAVDKNRGTTGCYDTRVISVSDEIAEGLEPNGSCLIEVEIDYRHVQGDPYTAVGA